MKSNKKIILGITLLLSMHNVQLCSGLGNPVYDQNDSAYKCAKMVFSQVAGGVLSAVSLISTLVTTAYVSAKITRVQESYMFPAVKLPYTGGLNNVFGADVAKESLRVLIRQINNPDDFIQKGIAPVSGVLLYGPPGTGKTLLARSLAEEANCSFINVASSELQTVRSIQVLFENARKQARAKGLPCIIFIDEIDPIACDRKSNQHFNGVALTDQLLIEMDGFTPAKSRVIVVAATNNRNVIDKAMIRPGRLELLIEVPAFDEATRKKFLMVCIQKITNLQFSLQFIDYVAKHTVGCGGAQIRSVAEGSARIAIAEGKETVEIEHFEKYKPTSSLFLDEQKTAQAA